MKNIHKKFLIQTTLIVLLSGSLFLGGCTNNITPTDPQSPYSSTPPTKQANPIADVTVTYSYGDTGVVQLSDNNLTLKVGQRLALQPAAGLTKSTRFLSSGGENFFGDIMKQDANQQDSTRATFTAINPGKGKLQIIPNNTETDRATDLWVTVQ